MKPLFDHIGKQCQYMKVHNFLRLTFFCDRSAGSAHLLRFCLRNRCIFFASVLPAEHLLFSDQSRQKMDLHFLFLDVHVQNTVMDRRNQDLAVFRGVNDINVIRPCLHDIL